MGLIGRLFKEQRAYFFLLALVACGPAVAHRPSPADPSHEHLGVSSVSSTEELFHLAESVHEAIERENPDLHGTKKWAEKFFYNWNYFRTLVNQMRLAHSLNGDNPNAELHIKNASALALFTHLTEHVIGHGTHFAGTYSSAAWVRWSTAVVGEAIASPFVEVVCIGGVCLYARSEAFRNGVTFTRVAGYKWLAGWWAEPLARAVGLDSLKKMAVQTLTGKAQLERDLKSPLRPEYTLRSSAGMELVTLKLETLPNEDVVLRSVHFSPQNWTPQDHEELNKALKVFGWNIRDAILSSADLIRKKQMGMLRNEVFFESLESEPDGNYLLEFKNGAIRRFSRPFLKNFCSTLLLG